MNANGNGGCGCETDTQLDCPVCGGESSARSTAAPGPLAVCSACGALFASGATMTTVLGPAPWAVRGDRLDAGPRRRDG